MRHCDQGHLSASVGWLYVTHNPAVALPGRTEQQPGPNSLISIVLLLANQLLRAITSQQPFEYCFTTYDIKTHRLNIILFDPNY